MPKGVSAELSTDRVWSAGSMDISFPVTEYRLSLLATSFCTPGESGADDSGVLFCGSIRPSLSNIFPEKIVFNGDKRKPSKVRKKKTPTISTNKAMAIKSPCCWYFNPVEPRPGSLVSVITRCRGFLCISGGVGLCTAVFFTSLSRLKSDIWRRDLSV